MQSNFPISERDGVDAATPDAHEPISKWEPDEKNQATYGSFVVMSGGPDPRHLPEHEHQPFARASQTRAISP
jgi:hypothetical protein